MSVASNHDPMETARKILFHVADWLSLTLFAAASWAYQMLPDLDRVPDTAAIVMQSLAFIVVIVWGAFRAWRELVKLRRERMENKAMRRRTQKGAGKSSRSREKD
jgi:ABC-type nickel/cobalt efflux system permease component RcnA